MHHFCWVDVEELIFCVTARARDCRRKQENLNSLRFTVNILFQRERSCLSLRLPMKVSPSHDSVILSKNFEHETIWNLTCYDLRKIIFSIRASKKGKRAALAMTAKSICLLDHSNRQLEMHLRSSMFNSAKNIEVKGRYSKADCQ
jgi:hypothetical protein